MNAKTAKSEPLHLHRYQKLGGRQEFRLWVKVNTDFISLEPQPRKSIGGLFDSRRPGI